MNMLTIGTVVAAATLGLGVGAAGAGSNHVINATMSTLPDTGLSGSGDSILDNCGASSGTQSATVTVKHTTAGSTVRFKVRDARPDTVYTVWLRIKGAAGHNDSGSPLTGGGATPLIAGHDIETANDFSPWGTTPAGNPNPLNGFRTDHKGDAKWTTHLDFPIVRGAYPFHMTSVSRPGFEAEPNVAKAIANPDDGMGGPFMFRVISHCTDDVGHGLSPGVREAWFQYP